MNLYMKSNLFIELFEVFWRLTVYIHTYTTDIRVHSSCPLKICPFQKALFKKPFSKSPPNLSALLKKCPLQIALRQFPSDNCPLFQLRSANCPLPIALCQMPFAYCSLLMKVLLAKGNWQRAIGKGQLAEGNWQRAIGKYKYGDEWPCVDAVDDRYIGA